MTIQDNIDAAKAEIEATQARLAQYESDLAAAIPHLSVLAEIESFASTVSGEAREAFAAAIAKARALF